MRRQKSWIESIVPLLLLSCLLALAFLILPILWKARNLPKAYADPLSLEEAGAGQTAKYVIALENSARMENRIEARDAAAGAVIHSLSYRENARAALLFFPYEAHAPLDFLPTNQAEERNKLLDLLDGEIEAQGETDLAGMLEAALEKFGDGPEERRVLFMVMGGSGGGAGEEAETGDERFFELCAQVQDEVELYIIYISEGNVPEKLEESLHTAAVTVKEDSGDAARRLSVWGEEETAKILSVSDISTLEAVLLDLHFPKAGAVFSRRVEESGAVSFPVSPLCPREITISVSDGSAMDAIRSINVGKKNLLDLDGVEFTESEVKIRSKKDLPSGLYTVEVSASQPLSMVIACQYDYQVRYGFLETEYAEKPPLNQDVTLYMQAVDPDGNGLSADDSVALSMNVYEVDASGEYHLLKRIQNGGTLPGSLLKAGASLELRPVAAHDGIVVEGKQGWTVQPADLPPALQDSCFIKLTLFPGATEISLGRIEDRVSDWETPAEDIRVFAVGEDDFSLKREGDELLLAEETGRDWWPFCKTYHLSVVAVDSAGQTATADWSVLTVAVMPVCLGIVLGIIVIMLLRWLLLLVGMLNEKREEAREEEKQKAKRLQRIREDTELCYQLELKVDKTFIRAGLCWALRDERGETILIGGLGLTDEKGRLQGGCDLSKASAYCLDEAGKVMVCQNPLDFGLWRYSVAYKCTELLLRASPKVNDCGVDALKRVVKGPPGTEGDIVCFGVNQALPHREVSLETPQGTFLFRLEYYTDHPPFYL